MVQFPGCPFRTLCIQARMTGIWPVGLPHSAIRGSRDVCSSPRLIAAYHGLLRTAAPRHPPWTLFRLTILLFALQPGPPTPARLQPFGSPAGTCAASPNRALLKLSLESTRKRQYHAPTDVSTPRSSLSLGQQLPSALLFTLPLRCQRSRTLEVWGLEPQTYGLQSHRSSH
jgi:hypothetical protein